MFGITLRQAETWIKAFVGIAFGFVTGYLVNQMNQEALLLMAAALISGFILWLVIIAIKKPPRLQITFREPRTIRSDWEAEAQAHRGYIGFVPLFTPFDKSSEIALMNVEAREALIRSIDIEAARQNPALFDIFKLENSNMLPTIRAISSHKHRLEHVWLLTTQSQGELNATHGQSQPYALLVEKYLKSQDLVAPDCEFHTVVIPLDDDVLIMNKTHALVEGIFNSARLLPKPLERREIVADITTGTRSMLLGLVLGCLNPHQAVQFIGTRYDAQSGKPTGGIFPIIFRFALQKIEGEEGER